MIWQLRLGIEEEKRMEDKREILARLLPALQATRAGSDVKDLAEYDDEYCVIVFQSGFRKRVCIGGDSGLAIIEDVIHALY